MNPFKNPEIQKVFSQMTKVREKQMQRDNTRQQKMKLIICMPLHGVVPVESFLSFMALRSHTLTYYESKWLYNQSAMVHFNRNCLADKAVNLLPRFKADYIIWIDSDQEIMPEVFDKHITEFEDSGYDIMNALNHTRDHSPMLYRETTEDHYNFIYLEKKDIGIVPVDSTGFNFIIMKPEVLEKMTEVYGFPMFDIKSQIIDGLWHTIGEDFMFLKRARQLGFKVGVNTNVKIGHVGGVIYD